VRLGTSQPPVSGGAPRLSHWLRSEKPC
jgi:hypothetical protein